MTLGTDFSRLAPSNGSSAAQEQNTVAVPEPLFKLLADYLAGRPWREVNHLIVALDRAYSASRPS